MVDVGELIGAMEKFGVSDGVLVPVAEAVEARPSMTLDEVVSMLRSKGVSVVVAYRVKNALSALSDRLSSSSASSEYPSSVIASSTPTKTAPSKTYVPADVLAKLDSLGLSSFKPAFRAALAKNTKPLTWSTIADVVEAVGIPVETAFALKEVVLTLPAAPVPAVDLSPQTVSQAPGPVIITPKKVSPAPAPAPIVPVVIIEKRVAQPTKPTGPPTQPTKPAAVAPSSPPEIILAGTCKPLEYSVDPPKITIVPKNSKGVDAPGPQPSLRIELATDKAKRGSHLTAPKAFAQVEVRPPVVKPSVHIVAQEAKLPGVQAVSDPAEQRLAAKLLAKKEADERQQQEAARISAEFQRLQQQRQQEQARRDEEQRRIAEEQRQREEQRIAEEQRAWAAEEARLREVAERREAEARRRAEEEKLAEQRRLAHEAKLAEQRRLAEEARLAEERRIAEQQRIAEEARLAELRRIEEEAIKAARKDRKADKRKHEREMRKMKASQLAEDSRIAEELYAAELRRLAEEAGLSFQPEPEPEPVVAAAPAPNPASATKVAPPTATPPPVPAPTKQQSTKNKAASVPKAAGCSPAEVAEDTEISTFLSELADAVECRDDVKDDSDPGDDEDEAVIAKGIPRVSGLLRRLASLKRSAEVSRDLFRAVWWLCRGNNLPIDSLFADGGDAVAKACVYGMENHRGNSTVQNWGVLLLQALAKRSDLGKRAVVANGGVTAIASSLSNHTRDDSLIVRACQVLLTIASDATALQAITTAEGFFTSVIGLMSRSWTKPSIAVPCCVMLGRLSISKTTHDALLAANCLTAVLDVMQRAKSNVALQSNGCAVLAGMAGSERGRTAILTSESGMQTLRLALDSFEDDEGIQAFGCRALSRLARHPSYRPFSDLSRLLRAIEKLPSSPPVVLAALKAMFFLLAEAAARTALATGGGIAHIMKAKHSCRATIPVQLAFVHVFLRLARDRKAKWWLTFATSPETIRGMNDTARLSIDENVKLRHACVMFVSVLAADVNTHRPLVQYGTIEWLKAVLETKSPSTVLLATVLQTLSNMVDTPGLEKEFLASNIWTAVCRLLNAYYDTPAIHKYGLNVGAKLSAAVDVRKAGSLLTEEATMTVLVSINFLSDEPDVVLRGWTAIMHGASSDAVQGGFLRAEGLRVLKESMTAWISKPGIQVVCCKLIERLAKTGSGLFGPLFMSQGIAEVLMRAQDACAHVPEVTAAARAALSSLSIGFGGDTDDEDD